MSGKIARWLDGRQMTWEGITLIVRRPKFWIAFVITFLIFGILLNMLAGGMAAIDLFGAVDFGGKMRLLGNAFLNIFGYGREFLDWFLTFSMCLLQALLIAMIAFIWKKRKDENSDPNNDKVGRSEHLQNAGIVAGLAILGGGCPTCGTALIIPILSSIFSTGSYAIAGTVTWILNILALTVALFALRRVGMDVYAIIKSENRRKNGRK